MPYSDLPQHAFWRLCRNDPEFRVSEIFHPKYRLSAGVRVATAGSCFAQNIGPYVRASELDFVDVEPAPLGMSAETAARFGYGLYSARYGNVYTARQLLQLIEDAWSETIHDGAIWMRGERFFDALRPNVEPDGLATEAEVRTHRIEHLRRVRRMFREADVFIFTLGLTEAWIDRKTGVVFPTAPGVVAGRYDPDRHVFANFGVSETFDELAAALGLVREANPSLKVLLTVSPVPLTATASGQHVLAATTYSKSVLRAVAGEIAATNPAIDYFPSYEIITGAPFAARYYKENLRNVTREGVDAAMSVFFAAQDGLAPAPGVGSDPAPEPVTEDRDEDAEICEEAMLEAFGT